MPLPPFLERLLFGRRPADPPAPEPEPPPEPGPEEPPAPPPPFDALAAWRTWVAEDEALSSLYRSLQVQPSLEDSCRELLSRIKGLLRVEIPDPEVFAEALERLARQAEEKASEVPPDAAWAQRGQDPLLVDVLARRLYPAAVVARLEERPVDELLPFLEEIPVRRGGEVVWRLPRELGLLRRRPARVEEFSALLDELGALVRRATLERPADSREAIYEGLARCSRDAADPAVYLPSSLRSLEEKVAEWLAPPAAEARLRRKQLDALLFGLLETGHSLARPRPSGDGAAVLRARSLAAEALKAPWLLVPATLSPLIYLLVRAELAPLPAGGGQPAATLEAVAAETESGFFDGEETARRLRSLEAHGLFVSSLLFPLLRLAAATAESVSPQAR